MLRSILFWDDLPGRRTPEALLLLMAMLGTASFALWTTLINNFAVEVAGFGGWEIGILQSVREIPGFLAFTAVYLILFLSEQRLAMWSLLLLALGTAITGLLPTFSGLLVTTIVMSIGFHYYETINQSLALQWLTKDRAPLVLGRIVAVRSLASIIVMGLIWVAFELMGLGFAAAYLAIGGGIIMLLLFVWWDYPSFPELVPQTKQIVLRRRYWLYYALVFLSGARRQIFIVFAGFLLVEKFGYSVGAITLLYLVNAVLNILLAPAIGKLIGRFGERRALTVEYVGLVLVFLSYAVVPTGWMAAGLYIVDHLFFALAIAIKTYFQKIGKPSDMTPTAAVSFTISHIAAVFIPMLYGIVWLWSPAAVFISGAVMAAGSLVLARLVPINPGPGNETLMTTPRVAQPAE